MTSYFKIPSALLSYGHNRNCDRRTYTQERSHETVIMWHCSLYWSLQRHSVRSMDSIHVHDHVYLIFYPKKIISLIKFPPGLILPPRSLWIVNQLSPNKVRFSQKWFLYRKMCNIRPVGTTKKTHLLSRSNIAWPSRKKTIFNINRAFS
jgi:hypothetical protein